MENEKFPHQFSESGWRETWYLFSLALIYFAASDLFLGLEHSDYICTGQAKRHAQDQRNAGKVELECFVKACFIFIEIVKY